MSAEKLVILPTVFEVSIEEISDETIAIHQESSHGEPPDSIYVPKFFIGILIDALREIDGAKT